MREPSPRTSRRAIGAGLAAAFAVGTVGFLLGRESLPVPPPAPAASPAAVPPAPSPAPSEPPASVSKRGDLLALVNMAADAFASGKAVPAEVEAAAGRQFDLVLPFGCSGPNNPSASALGWQYDAGTATLRVSATPVTWSHADWQVREGDEAATAVGFWINRPWSGSEDCPTRVGEAGPAGTAAISLPGQTIAIASFSGSGALGREGRAFETVRRVPGFDGSKGLRLRITGRLDRAMSGGPVRCVQPAGVDQRPICVIAAVMEEFRLDNPATGKTFASWMIGRTG